MCFAFRAKKGIPKKGGKFHKSLKGKGCFAFLLNILNVKLAFH